MLKDIYYAFVHPYILYGVEIYANTKSTYLDKLIKLNNKLRILQNRSITTPICQLYKSYNTLLIPDLHKHKQQLLHFVYKYVIHHPALLPEAFINSRYFIFNDEIHNYNTRTKTNLHLYYSSSSAGLRTTRHKAAVLWNELPLSLSSSLILSLVFKVASKKFLLSQTHSINMSNLCFCLCNWAVICYCY